jgi:hypothetical protein
VSFEVILPFLRRIEHLIKDPEVSEIMVNGSSRVFVERALDSDACCRGFFSGRCRGCGLSEANHR